MDPRYIVTLSGREYPLFAGILAEAHERGLQSIETQLIQIPAEENGSTAIVKAVIRMKDGSTFEEYGDASPRNVNPRIATALIRMASTRAKGRALRDAVNIGQTMLEELPDMEDSSPARGGARATAPRGERDANPAPQETAGFEATYTEDGKSYTRAELVSYALQAKDQALAQGIRCETIDPTKSTNQTLVAFGRAIRPKLAVTKAVAEGAQGQSEAKRKPAEVAG